MIRALVLGGAADTFEEAKAAQAMASFDIVVATNDAGVDYPGQVDHWATFHPEKMPDWITRRLVEGRPHVAELWTAAHKAVPAGLTFRRVDSRGGSSGLLAVFVALDLGADKIVCCGCPMEARGEHYHTPGRWAEATKYRHAWERESIQARFERVRSMSGFTRRLLGVPDGAWLVAEPMPVGREAQVA